MKKFIYLLFALCSIMACKKETTTAVTKLKSIAYTNGTSLQNKTYTIYRNSNDLIDSVVLIGADGTYKRYVFFQTSGKLDSILLYNASNTVIIRSIATWSGNNLISFWNLSYLYDSENRITKKSYQSGAYIRGEHFADSSVYYFYDGINPEYKDYVQYYNKSVKNPLKIYKYENAYPINDLVFNSISSDFDGLYTYAYGNYNEYNNAGDLTFHGSYSSSGDINGYPTSMQYTSNGITSYTYTLTFTYE